jgi:F-type H+-transporting ATPase subunit epsilon
MRVSVISPERQLFAGEAVAVVAPAFDGLVGILPGHAPFLTLLGEGELTVDAQGGGGQSRFKVRGGFLQVADAAVRVVADYAEIS